MIIKSSSPSAAIPDVPITEYVLRHTERLGDKPALIEGDRVWSWTRLVESRNRLGNALLVGNHQGGMLVVELRGDHA